LVAYYLYVWLAIDPRLIHHSLGILTPYFDFSFEVGWPFFLDRLACPGGLVEYAARFLSQLYSVGWVGALIVTAAAWSTCLFTDRLAGLSGRPCGVVVRYVPAAIILMLYGACSHPLSTILSLLAALTCFLLYVGSAPNDTRRRPAVLLAASGAVYWAAAGGGGLLFAALVAVYERSVEKRRLVAAVAVLAFLGVPWILGTILLGLSPERAYGRFLLLDPGIAPAKWPYAAALFLFFPAVLARPRVPAGASLQRIRSWLEKVFRFPWPWAARWSIQMAVVVAATGAGVWLSRADEDRALLAIDYYSQQERWAQVLKAAERRPPGQTDLRSNRNVILALYHLGRLGDQMFRYPQTPTMSLYSSPPLERDHGDLYQLSRLFLYLGQVNYAEKCAYDALDITGDLPALLEHLAVISLVKDQPDTARLFLTALGKNPLHARRAGEMLRRLERDLHGDQDPRVRTIRSNLSTRDLVDVKGNIEDLLLALLADNPGNRMAFELLMAQYLWNGQPDKVAENLWRLADFGDQRIPRHYQEAVLMNLGPFAKDAGAMGDRIEPEVIREAELFAEIMRHSPDRLAAAAEAIEAGLGGTYPFYLTFHLSGL
jgi:hypothetical protein